MNIEGRELNTETNTMRNTPVLAMYDVRGIQKYIFKTIKVKDARGASGIIENIIEDAINFAVNEIKKREGYTDLKAETRWHDGSAPFKYVDNDNDIQILFSGGGNASFIFSSKSLCVEINKLMSKYVLDNTYSLQLAIAFIEKTDNYSEDYKKVNAELAKNKAKMVSSLPLGTLPIMKMEIKTGYPIEKLDIEKLDIALRDKDNQKSKYSRETAIKMSYAKKQNEKAEKVNRRFEDYITKKGKDSNLAVVHIDGNNMGQRIRTLIADVTDYQEAVNKIREISFSINHGYKSVFDEMSKYYNATGKSGEKDDNNFVLKILVAGDDITYICNAGIALDTVNYYCNAITEKTMIKKEKKDDSIEFLKKYGFSVCAGIAFFTSHFPFYIAYDVAESCCDNAKKYAKANKIDGVVSNWLDYQICKNIQTIDLDGVRESEYITSENEILYRRPYYVTIEQYSNSKKCFEDFEKRVSDIHKYSELEKAILHFKDTDKIPRSISKEIRNLYPEGEKVISSYTGFLKSRNHKLPGNDYEMYVEEIEENKEENNKEENNNGESNNKNDKNKEKSKSVKKIAKWYDALEILDYYVPQFKYYESELIKRQGGDDSDE